MTTLSASPPSIANTVPNSLRAALPLTHQALLHIASGGHVFADDIEWTEFIDLARNHALTPQVYHNLSSTHAPHNVRQQIAHLYLNGCAQTRAQAERVRTALGLLQERGIRTLVLKGLHLTLTIYADLGRRNFGDTDLFIDRADVPAAHAALVDAGYRIDHTPVLPAPREFRRFLACTQDKDYVYIGLDGSVIELHWALQRPSLGLIVTFEEAWEERRSVDHGGVAIPGLGNAHHLIFLSTHGTRHRWRRLEWLFSLGELADRLTEAEWQEVWDLAKRRGLTYAVAFSLHLVNELARPEHPFRMVGHAPAVRDRHTREVLDVIASGAPDSPRSSADRRAHV